MDFSIPKDVADYLVELDDFIEKVIKPLEKQERQYSLLRSSPRMGAHRFRTSAGCRATSGKRCWARCAGAPTRPGTIALRCRKNSAARTAPISRWRSFASTWRPRASGLHNDLQNESSVVGNFPTVLMFRDFGTEEQKKNYPGILDGTMRRCVRPHRAQSWLGRDLDGNARRERRRWLAHQRREDVEHGRARRDPRFGFRAHQRQGRRARAASPVSSCRWKIEGVKIEEYMWTFNMPTDHARVSFKNVWVPASDAFLGIPRTASCWRGISCTRTASARRRRRWARRNTASTKASTTPTAQAFRQAAVANQAIQWPLVELQTEARCCAGSSIARRGRWIA